MYNLRQFREERGWSQLDLAVRLSVSVNSVYKWEHGLATPSEANSYRLVLLFITTGSEDVPQHSPPPVEEHYSGGDMAGVG